jgi:hypothetical protein
MKKPISTLLAGALIGATFVVPVTTPAAAESRWDRVGENGWHDDGWRWRNRHHGDRDRDWDDDRRHGWRHDGDNDDFDFDEEDLAAGVAGFAAGALFGSLATGSSSHVARCEAEYQSYDRASDTYLGYDGYRHQCML